MANVKAVLAKAIKNEATLGIEAEAKRRDQATAEAERSNLVEAAGGGKNIDAADLLASDEKARVAKAEADIAQAIYDSAKNQLHRVQIDAWYGEAAELLASIDAAGASLVAAAVDVDCALDALKSAIRIRNARATDFNEAQQSAARFNNDRDARQSSNPVLASFDSGVDQPNVGGLTYRIGGGFQALRIHSLLPPNIQHVAASDAAAAGVKIVPAPQGGVA